MHLPYTHHLVASLAALTLIAASLVFLHDTASAATGPYLYGQLTCTQTQLYTYRATANPPAVAALNTTSGTDYQYVWWLPALYRWDSATGETQTTYATEWLWAHASDRYYTQAFYGYNSGAGPGAVVNFTADTTDALHFYFMANYIYWKQPNGTWDSVVFFSTDSRGSVAACSFMGRVSPMDGGAAGPEASGALSFLGDANCDGSVNAIDAALILQLNAGIVNSLQCQAGADANGDGSVNAIDAALVLQLGAGIIDTLEPPPPSPPPPPPTPPAPPPPPDGGPTLPST